MISLDEVVKISKKSRDKIVSDNLIHFEVQLEKLSESITQAATNGETSVTFEIVNFNEIFWSWLLDKIRQAGYMRYQLDKEKPIPELEIRWDLY